MKTTSRYQIGTPANFFVFPDCLRHLRVPANQKRRSTATLASAPHVTRVHFWKKCRAPINIPIATKLRRLEVPFLESQTVGIFQSTDSHFEHRAISRYFFAFRRGPPTSEAFQKNATERTRPHFLAASRWVKRDGCHHQGRRARVCRRHGLDGDARERPAGARGGSHRGRERGPGGGEG